MKLPRMGRKGYSLNLLYVAGLFFIMTVVVLAFGSIFLAKLKNLTDDAKAQSIIDIGVTALGDLAGWLGLIALAVGGTISLAFIIRGLSGLGFGGGGGE